jgi:hypothetical protein
MISFSHGGVCSLVNCKLSCQAKAFRTELLEFAKFVIRKEAIHTVPYGFYSMLSMFCFKENPGITLQISAERGKARNPRKIVISLAAKRARSGL